MENFYFDVVKSYAHRQGEIIKHYENNFIFKILKFFGYYLFPLSLIFWLVGLFLKFELSSGYSSLINFISAPLLIITGSSLWFLWFYHDRLVKAKTSLSIYKAKELLNSNQKFNFAECIDPESGIGVFLHAYYEAQKAGVGVLDPVFIFLGMLKSKAGRYLLIRLGINPYEINNFLIKPIIDNLPKSEGQINLSSELIEILKESLEIALQVSEEADMKKETINSGDIILATFRKSKFFQNLLVELELKPEDIKNIIDWYYLQKRFVIKKPFWDPTTVISGIGDEWSFGYINILNQFGIDWSKKIAANIHTIHTYGLNDTIEELERVLIREDKNNALLVGEEDVGRTPVVNGLIAKIIKKETQPQLWYKHVYKVNVGALISGASRLGEVQARIQAIFDEAIMTGNIILFFEDIHHMFSSKEHTGAINAASIVLPYLRQSSLEVIGTTTPESYHRDIEASPGIRDAFAKIEVKEPSKEVVISVLEDVIPRIEYKNNIIFLYKSLKEVVRVCDRYIYHKPFPAKAVELVDEVAAYVRQNKGKNGIVTKEDVDFVVSQKINMPVGEADEAEKKKLLNLEDFLRQRVIGQEEALKVISAALRRARSGFTSGKKPIGTFLFLGPTGVGKTETARALAELYFGSEKEIIRLDMSEFNNPQSIYRLIGSPPAEGSEGTQGQLTRMVKDKPFSLILLDELEKAHPDILNVFLQVFEDGRLTDGTGKTINFTNTIIIATSNAGAELIREEIQKGNISNEILKEKLLDFLQSQGIFKPEFLNRFDAVVAFRPLSKKELNKIINLMINDLNKNLSEKEVSVELTSEAIEKVINKGYDPVFGARPLRRALQDTVENLVAQKLLEGSLQKGQKLVIKGEDIQ